jgi:hypothetical protein
LESRFENRLQLENSFAKIIESISGGKMIVENDRLSRINEIIEKNENEVGLLKNFLENPFSRGDYYKKIKKSQSYLEDNSKSLLSIFVWVVNIILWGILIIGLLNIKKLIIEGLIFALISFFFTYLLSTIRIVIFCKRRIKELQELIYLNKKKILDFK